MNMKAYFFLTIGFLFISHTSAQTAGGISKKQSDIIFEKTKDFPIGTELSVAFIKDGQVSFYGTRRVKDSLESVQNADKIFEIGSITKVFTATLLADFVLEDKIKLEDPIQEYLPFSIKNDSISVLQLANHTSGLPRLPLNLDLETADSSNPYNDYGDKNLKEYLTGGLQLESTPGSTYVYSNVGVGILGYILKGQGSVSYEELLQNRIFSKYGMSNSTTNFDNVKPQLIDGLDSDGNKTAHWDLNALVGAGGILSNVSDLSKFALAQFDDKNKDLALTRQSTFKIPAYRMEVGLAWNIIKPDANLKWYMHNGGTGGYTSIIAMDTTNKNGVVILSNVSAFNVNARNIDQLCLGLMKTLY